MKDGDFNDYKMHINLYDWNGICWDAALSILSGRMPLTEPDEPREIEKRIALMVMTLHNRYKNEGTFSVLAMDSKPYWREEYLTEWYKEHSRYWGRLAFNSPMEREPDIGIEYIWFNNTIFPIIDGQIQKSLNKEPMKKVIGLAGDPKSWYKVPEEYWALLPEYKGSRGKSEDCGLETPRSEVQKIFSVMAKKLAPLINGTPVLTKEMEADDIAGTMCATKKEDTFIQLFSKDGDWKQLVKDGVDMYDFSKRVMYRWDDRPKISEEFRIKLIAGDSGDGIKGIYKGDKACYSEKGAITGMKDGSVDKDIEAYPEVLQRNKDLITLPAPCRSLHMDKLRIQKALKNPQVATGYKWQDFGITEKAIKDMEDLNEIMKYIEDLRLDRIEKIKPVEVVE